VDVAARIVTLELAETFVISRGARDTEDLVEVTLTCSGVRGYGEAAPIERYDESHESALAYVEEHAGLIGDDPFALEEIMARFARMRARRSGGDRRRAARPPGQARRQARVPAAWTAAAGPADLVDDLAPEIPTTWRAAPRRCAAASSG